MTLEDFCVALENDSLPKEYEDIANFCLKPVIERAHTALLDFAQLLLMALENEDFAYLLESQNETYPFSLYDSLVGILLYLNVPYNDIRTLDAKFLLLKLYYELFRENPQGTDA